MLAGTPISLNANGPSPAALTLRAGLYPIWLNRDTVPHTVTFANGCSIQVAAGAMGQCGNRFSEFVGNYAYTVDGTTRASVVVTPEGRTVTLEARSHRIGRGSNLTLRGRLAVAPLSPPALEGPRQPLIVLARPDRHHPFQRIAVVTAQPHRSNRLPAHSVWHLRVRARHDAIYIVEADSQPAGGQYWKQAWSKPFRVRVAR